MRTDASSDKGYRARAHQEQRGRDNRRASNLTDAVRLHRSEILAFNGFKTSQRADPSGYGRINRAEVSFLGGAAFDVAGRYLDSEGRTRCVKRPALCLLNG